MFARLLVIVIVGGSTGLGVLTVRQRQLRAGHELASARLEMMRVEERIRRVRAEIARQTSPQNVRLLGDALGELVPARAGEFDYPGEARDHQLTHGPGQTIAQDAT